jgi:hypothetical protein
MENHERRKNIRFKSDGENNSIVIRLKNESAPIHALILDESFKGISCVYVGENAAEIGSTLYWQETATILTKCKVIRCDKIQHNVYNLTFLLEL